MNSCEDLIEHFKKSLNDETCKVEYNWKFHKNVYYKSNIIGIFDNKICIMTIDEEKKLLNNKSIKQSCRFDTLYTDWGGMNVCTYCEIKNK